MLFSSIFRTLPLGVGVESRWLCQFISSDCGHTHPASEHASKRTTTTIIQSGEVPFQQARSPHPIVGSWIVLSPKQAAQHNPSYPALGCQDTTSPWSTDHGGNISKKNGRNEKKKKNMKAKSPSNGPLLTTLSTEAQKSRVFVEVHNTPVHISSRSP